MRIERANRQMATLAFPLNATDRPTLDPAMEALINDGFDEVNGCVILRRFRRSADATTIEGCGDETGFEAFVNHIHLEDLLAPSTTPQILLAQAAEYVRRLATQLSVAYPDRRFQIIVAVGDSCTVRFHTVRIGMSWLGDDLDAYPEAVLSVAVNG